MTNANFPVLGPNIDPHLKDKFHSPTQGCFISFEGIEACGKSTQLKYLQQAFAASNLTSLLVREPGSTAFGEHLRQAILASSEALDPIAEACLFAAARSQLLTQTILPALKQEQVVIADRYLDSSLAYQGWARGLGLDSILTIHQFHPLNTLPHLTFYLRISPEVSLARQKQRAQKADYFEQQDAAFYQKLVEGYDQLASLWPKRIVALDGTLPPPLIFTSILSSLAQRWPHRPWPSPDSIMPEG